MGSYLNVLKPKFIKFGWTGMSCPCVKRHKKAYKWSGTVQIQLCTGKSSLIFVLHCPIPLFLVICENYELKLTPGGIIFIFHCPIPLFLVTCEHYELKLTPRGIIFFLHCSIPLFLVTCEHYELKLTSRGRISCISLSYSFIPGYMWTL